MPNFRPYFLLHRFWRSIEIITGTCRRSVLPVSCWTFRGISARNIFDCECPCIEFQTSILPQLILAISRNFYRHLPTGPLWQWGSGLSHFWIPFYHRLNASRLVIIPRPLPCALPAPLSLPRCPRRSLCRAALSAALPAPPSRPRWSHDPPPPPQIYTTTQATSSSHLKGWPEQRLRWMRSRII